MAIVLTNGKDYVKRCTCAGEELHTTQNVNEAKVYFNVNTAQRKLMRAPEELKGFYIWDTEGTERPRQKAVTKRRIHSKKERLYIYHKYHERCALCGKAITYEELTLDHINPLYRGGTDTLDNIQAACFACNQFKANIKPEDFHQKIEEIFLYQTEKRHGKELRWKIAKKLLQGMM